MRFLCFLGIILFIGGCRTSVIVPPPQKEPIFKPNVLRVGTLYGSQIYMIDDNGPSGFDYEMSKEFAQYLGLPLDIQPYPDRSSLFRALEQGNVDLIAAAFQQTPARNRRFRFSPPLYRVNQVLIYRKNTKAPINIDDIDEPISVMANSSYEETLIELKQTHRNLKWTPIYGKDNEELLEMVDRGEIKYTISDSTIVKVNQRFMPEIRQGIVLAKQRPIVWMLPPTNSDKTLSQLLAFWHQERKSGNIAFLKEKYFGHVKKFDYVDTRAFIRAVSSVLPLYQPLFELHGKDIDWRKLAATSYQESHWNPAAKSFTGVRGMMMLTSTTAKELGINDRLDPAKSIRGGATYLRNMLNRLPDVIPENQRMWFALASYNIGLGHVIDARKLAAKLKLNPNSWRDLKKVLPLLQKRKYYRKLKYGYGRGKEAVHYVDSIRRYYDTLLWIDQQSTRKQLKKSLIATI
ncbi:membrane-bound lytic murein transglycosylase MltF [Parashewanella spongiae]|uniref:Membrane-bound lytic murein transglycosylase F n=2 Tax=Parashewanella spongiae TaxID=342950 RepID=A0A3A6TFV2_9GAMM|nr:membrane-bound lytic murein transglycosylase MltF [Parashewanella spongiae]RJY06365.1 membrane-bound lytic murein transglycosylase MltF [Parashewanella spongiae]